MAEDPTVTRTGYGAVGLTGTWEYIAMNPYLAFSLVVIVTSGSATVFRRNNYRPGGGRSQDPEHPGVGHRGLTFAIATVEINIVSPAYDLANFAPKHIDFKRGGLITAIASVLVTPWNTYNSPVAINYFLGGLGAFLGPLFGVIFVDYYLVRRGRVDALYLEGEPSPYWYRGGFNRRAILVFAISGIVAVVVALVPTFGALSPFSWFIGAGLSAILYYVLARSQSEHASPTSHEG